MAIQLKVIDPTAYVLTGTNAFACPVCGGARLHHNNVRVWCRDTEDAGGIFTEIDGGDGMNVYKPVVTTKRVDADAIAHRRNVIEIDFKCEAGCKLTMQLHQHKGVTFAAWTTAQPKP